ncbi:hypothetical protein BCR34DRAFT_552760, partial [Clohesyomyces aquaticus]
MIVIIYSHIHLLHRHNPQTRIHIHSHTHLSPHFRSRGQDGVRVRGRCDGDYVRPATQIEVPSTCLRIGDLALVLAPTLEHAMIGDESQGY